jgi:CDP-paratose 2-epimerase
MLEAIDACERIACSELDWTLSDAARVGDHRWWISDLEPFRSDYPAWELTNDVDSLLRGIHEANVERWGAARA